jgi:glycosyltransferase involved in cell wall biosynthesis
MKALLISEFGALNGGEFSFLTALPHVQKAGFEFTAALPPDSGFATLLQKNGVPVTPFSFHDDDGLRKPLPELRNELAALIEKTEAGIVHANSLSAGRVLGPVTSDSDVIGIGYIRDIIKLSRKATQDVAMLDHIVAVSQATADFHVSRGVPEPKIEVIHNGVDLERFCPGEGTPSGKVCLCIGQIGMRKGLELSLELLANAFKEVPEAELWIVGERHSRKLEAIEYEQELHRFAKENFPDHAVKWLGRRSDVPDLMRQARVLVHAAKQEPLGRVLLEAAASGLPIVTTNVGGTPEILQGLESLMFAPDSFHDALPKLIKLLNDDQLHLETSKHLRTIAADKFSAERAGNDLARLYLNCLQ